MSEERFDQIIDAIIDGKYSWACVLILETAGYNPLHYIPYRTYNRLIKQNCTSSQSRKQAKQKQQSTSEISKENQSNSQIRDLDYLKKQSKTRVTGGRTASGYADTNIYNLSFFSGT